MAELQQAGPVELMLLKADRSGAVLVLRAADLAAARAAVASPEPPPGESGGQPPRLDELRIHQCTVWRWNRTIYEPSASGHLRIEMRTLPSGPAVIDMPANAAFLLGLSLWAAGQDPQWTYALPFECADNGFHRAAQRGLDAHLSWPSWHRDQIRTLTAARLVIELLPAAREGLLPAGVVTAEADTRACLTAILPARIPAGPSTPGPPAGSWNAAASAGLISSRSVSVTADSSAAACLGRLVRGYSLGLPGLEVPYRAGRWSLVHAPVAGSNDSCRGPRTTRSHGSGPQPA